MEERDSRGTRRAETNQKKTLRAEIHSRAVESWVPRRAVAFDRAQSVCGVGGSSRFHICTSRQNPASGPSRPSALPTSTLSPTTSSDPLSLRCLETCHDASDLAVALCSTIVLSVQPVIALSSSFHIHRPFTRQSLHELQQTIDILPLAQPLYPSTSTAVSVASSQFTSSHYCNHHIIFNMPSSRRLRVTGFIAVIAFLIILYVTRGASNTFESPFYTRTVDALRTRKDAEAAQLARDQEMERMARVKTEHDHAVNEKVAEEHKKHQEKAEAAPHDDAVHRPKPPVGEKAVAGRKTMKDGKVVTTRPADDDDDGVAKVGNIAAKQTDAAKESSQTDEEKKVEAELNRILKNGPIIIFSKSYCPFSKKAKHILLDQYTIDPAPYVVELDHHELGSGLQDALLKSTGRRTVPNVLINGKSIGGGDDVDKLHREGKIVSTIQSMGGKRIVKVEPNEAKMGLKFKA